jgi:phage terminase large subunit
LQRRGHIYGRNWLPHDAEAKSLGTGKSIQQIMHAHGRQVYIVPKLSVEDGVTAARTIFPNRWFDEENCADSPYALRHYRYEVDEDLGTFSKKPLYDWALHGADGFCYFAVATKPKPRRVAEVYARRRSVYRERGLWMAA